MDRTDRLILAALKRNARLSVSELAAAADVTRATARARLERMMADGRIRGFTALTDQDFETNPVRGLMMLAIDGAGGERVIRELLRLPEVSQVHSTNGKWDLIVELGTQSLPALDSVLSDIRKIAGVRASETNLLLNTRRAGRV